MKLKLVRQVKNIKQEQLKEDENKMDEVDYEKDMVQYSLDDDGLKEIKGENDSKKTEIEGGKDMEARQTDEELKEKLRGINNRNKPQEMSNEDEVEKEAFKRMRNMENFPSLSNSKISNKNENDDNVSFEFHNVLVTMRDGKPFKYHVSLSVRQLAEMYSGNDSPICYDETTQRGTKHTKSKGDVPLLYKKNVDLILKAMLDGSINGGCIYLNYAKENPSPLIYDSENGTLKAVDGKLAILDGAHRLESCRIWFRKYSKSKGLMKNPDDFYFPVTIENVDHETAKNIFVELNSLGKSISKTRIAYHSVFDPSNTIAQRVMNSSQLRGKVELISNSIKKSSGNIITFGSLLKGCASMKAETESQATKIGDFLILFWNQMIENFPKLMGNVDPEIRTTERQKSFASEVLFMNSYFVLAKELMGRDDWKERLSKLSTTDFLSRDNELWIKNITRNEGKLVNTSATQKFTTDEVLKFVLGD